MQSRQRHFILSQIRNTIQITTATPVSFLTYIPIEKGIFAPVTTLADTETQCQGKKENPFQSSG